MNQWQGSARRRFGDVKQKCRLYLRRCGPNCLMNFLLDGESFSMYRSCAFSASCFRTRLSVRVASLKRCLDYGNLLVSRTSRSICRLVLKWLVCPFLPCGVEIVAASTSMRSPSKLQKSTNCPSKIIKRGGQ